VEICLADNGCFAPQEILHAPCFFISVYAANAHRRITTDLFKFPVLQSGYTKDTVQPLCSHSENSVSLHSPAGEGQIRQIRQAANGAVEITKDGVEWEYMKGVADEALINVIDF
jgi:hypothetical protein